MFQLIVSLDQVEFTFIIAEVINALSSCRRCVKS